MIPNIQPREISHCAEGRGLQLIKTDLRGAHFHPHTLDVSLKNNEVMRAIRDFNRQRIEKISFATGILFHSRDAPDDHGK
jgi:hypothetical protein